MNKFLLAAMFGSTLLGGPAYAQADPTLATPPPGDRPMPPRPDPAERLMRADANHDGVVTRAEAIAEAERRFARLDVNGDGYITQNEIAPDGPPRGGPGLPPPPGDEHAERPRIGARMFERIDANDDGRLSRDEYIAADLKLFDRLDANHDGKVDRAEIDAMMAMRGMGGRGRGGGDMPPPPPGRDQ